MEEFLKKIKKQIKGLEDKKVMNYLVVILISSVLILIFIRGSYPKKQKKIDTVIKKDSDEYNIEVENYESIVEKKLVHILKKLEGVGDVDVMLTLEDSIEKVPASNTTITKENTKETDSEGGIREVTKEDESNQLLNVADDIMVLKEINPNIKGVIVIAKGAEDPIVLENIYLAVQTVLGLSSNKVEVFSSK